MVKAKQASNFNLILPTTKNAYVAIHTTKQIYASLAEYMEISEYGEVTAKIKMNNKFIYATKLI